MDERYILCYVDGPWAWFTTAPLSDQWGDDWNDAPYEHNAGDPYRWREGDKKPPYELAKVAVEGDFERPCDYTHGNSTYSVDMINAGAVPWMQTDRLDILSTPPEKRVRIMGGTPWPEFVELCARAGWTICAPLREP